MFSYCFLLLLLRARVNASNQTDERSHWDYGHSPSIPDSPMGAGTGDWNMAYTRARASMARLSNAEKQNLSVGIYPSPNGCVGFSGGAPSIGFPGLCLQDGPTGVRGAELVSSWPSGMHMGATWNVGLAFDVGKYMGMEFKKKGVHVALGPVVGPLGRVARGGRNWEGLSNDPYLAGQLVAPTVKGLQKSVIACVKHLVANEQEVHRRPSPFDSVAGVSSNIDDRTMHELYLWPFVDAVKAGVGSVMCSYNRVNNSYACQNSKMLNGLLKTELGFQGFVVTDWLAQHSGVASAANGLDMVMPDAGFWKDGNLETAVNNGSLPQARLDDMATRILASWYLLGMDSANYPPAGVGLPISLTKAHSQIDARDPAAKQTLLQSAIEGHVLVKNIDNTLPFKRPKILSLFGFDAYAPLVNNPSTQTMSRWFLGLTSVDTTDLSLLLSAAIGSAPETANVGTLSFGGGSGASTGSYISSPYGAFEQKAYEDDIALHWDLKNQNPDVNAASDACIVFINEFAAEAFDRPALADAGADLLVLNVATKCKDTIVVIHNAGIRLVDKWIDHPNVKAVIYAHLPGQDSGRAVVDILFGKVSPSGRLPYTVAKKPEDYGHMLNPSLPGDATTNTASFPQSDFNESLYIDYRYFLQQQITPRFEFGFGLTYTTFTYSMLSARLSATNPPLLPPTSPLLEGGKSSLFEVVATVECVVTNTGPVAAAEVAQLYIAIPNAPERQLRGFTKGVIQPGESANARFALTRRDLSIWDVGVQEWVLQRGGYEVMVGKSELDVKLRDRIVI